MLGSGGEDELLASLEPAEGAAAVDIPRRRVAAAPRLRRGCSAETSHGDADNSAETRRRDADVPRRRAATTRTFGRGPGAARRYLAQAGPGLAAPDWPTRRAALASLHALAIGAPKELRPHLATAASVAAETLRRVASGQEDPRCALEACRLVGALASASHEAYQRKAASGEVETPLAALAAALPRQGARISGALCAAVSIYVAAGGDAADAEDHLDWVERPGRETRTS